MRYLIAIIIWIAEIVGGIVAVAIVIYGPWLFARKVMFVHYGVDGLFDLCAQWVIATLVLGLILFLSLLAFCGIAVGLQELKPINKLLRLAKFNLKKADQLSPHFNKTLETVKKELEEAEKD